MGTSVEVITLWDSDVNFTRGQHDVLVLRTRYQWYVLQYVLAETELPGVFGESEVETELSLVLKGPTLWELLNNGMLTHIANPSPFIYQLWHRGPLEYRCFHNHDSVFFLPTSGFKLFNRLVWQLKRYTKITFIDTSELLSGVGARFYTIKIGFLLQNLVSYLCCQYYSHSST